MGRETAARGPTPTLRVFTPRSLQEDIDAVHATGLFDDVNIIPAAAPGASDDAPLVDVTLALAERKSGGLSAGGGISAQGAADGALPGFIGSASFSQRNLFGTGQKVAATLEAGQVDKLFRVNWADPWRAGDAWRTARSASLQNTRSAGGPIHGRPSDEPPVGGSSASLPGVGGRRARRRGRRRRPPHRRRRVCAPPAPRLDGHRGPRLAAVARAGRGG